MEIKNMFVSDIDRQINGVIKVAQQDENSLKQELEEYVVTTELRRHFDTFFDNYSKSLVSQTNNVGVWISGFYGSGKSHFLKILSYILANKEVAGKKASEYFEDKFDDAMMYATVKQCVNVPTETILFNVDVEGGEYKDATAILKVFAKTFYNHLGYYGDDLKIVKLEKYIDQQGKREEFQKVFEEVNGDTWINARNATEFFEDDLVEVFKQVLGMSEESARNWFSLENTSEISVATLCKDINTYVESREDNFRLLFMVDEVGQYINSNVDLKINLQSIVEELGAHCAGKAWVIVTSQEAIDSFTKHNDMDFSGILGRFNTKLSLTSSSADEVIKKRILKKNEAATDLLKMSYNQNYAIIKNIFSFTDCVMDIKGYADEQDYVDTFPFVPYQFIIIQKVFDAIRNYGIASKHQSSGERSLLECYQIAAQKVKTKDENTIVPFYYFYDTVSNALDTTIRRVIDRCQKAANNNDGIEEIDVCVLKLLYLLRYIEDIPSNVDNITNLMIDDINADKIKMREEVQASLNRLILSNYVARSGDKYNFLTDDEQDIARDIRNTNVDGSDIRKQIADIVFGDIYASQKYTYNKTPFEFNKYIDETVSGSTTAGITLCIVTEAGDLGNASEQKLIMESQNNKAIIVLSKETTYYQEIEQALKIRKFAKSRNISQLSEVVQAIVKKHQTEAKGLETRAKGYIENAVVEATYYVNGQKRTVKAGNAKDKIDTLLKDLVESVYSSLNMVNVFCESDADIRKILTEPANEAFLNVGLHNEEAINEVALWLQSQAQLNFPVTMGDVQSRYTSIPYGWKEIDIAAIIARLIVQQKIEITYGNAVVDKTDTKLVDYLRKRSEVDKVTLKRHVPVDEALIRKTTTFLREYIHAMNIPTDESELIEEVINIFEKKQQHYSDMLENYNTGFYPQKELVEEAITAIKSVLSQRKNNVALLTHIVTKQDDLLDLSDDLEPLEEFFKSQKGIFDKAVDEYKKYTNEKDYFSLDIISNINEIDSILKMPRPYSRIKDLPELQHKINILYQEILTNKQEEVKLIINNCVQDILNYSNDEAILKIIENSKHYYETKNIEVENTTSLITLDAMITQLQKHKDTQFLQVDQVLQSINQESEALEDTPIVQQKTITVKRYDLCPVKRLHTKEEIDEYLETMKNKLYNALEDNDTIQIS